MSTPQFCVCFLGFSLLTGSFHRVESWPLAALELKEHLSCTIILSVPGKTVIDLGYVPSLTVSQVQ